VLDSKFYSEPPEEAQSQFMPVVTVIGVTTLPSPVAVTFAAGATTSQWSGTEFNEAASTESRE
jgi:hypothetical protein